MEVGPIGHTTREREAIASDLLLVCRCVTKLTRTPASGLVWTLMTHRQLLLRLRLEVGRGTHEGERNRSLMAGCLCCVMHSRHAGGGCSTGVAVDGGQPSDQGVHPVIDWVSSTATCMDGTRSQTHLMALCVPVCVFIPSGRQGKCPSAGPLAEEDEIARGADGGRAVRGAAIRHAHTGGQGTHTQTHTDTHFSFCL